MFAAWLQHVVDAVDRMMRELLMLPSGLCCHRRVTTARHCMVASTRLTLLGFRVVRSRWLEDVS